MDSLKSFIEKYYDSSRFFIEKEIFIFILFYQYFYTYLLIFYIKFFQKYF